MAVVEELVALLGFKLEGQQNAQVYIKNLNLVNQAVQRTAGQMRAASSAFKGGFFGGLIGGVAVEGVSQLTRILTAIPKAIITTSATFEKLSVSLETVEGSAAKAKASMEWITDFAEKTPFELQEVADAFVRLRAYGLDPTTGMLESVGNAASSIGAPLMKGVEAIADAATFQFERLREFGITTEQKGKEVTFSWVTNGKTLTKTVQKDGAVVTKTITDIFKRYDGAMEKQSRTFGGIASNIRDTWSKIAKAIGDAGVFEIVKNGLRDILTWSKRLAADGSIRFWVQDAILQFHNWRDWITGVFIPDTLVPIEDWFKRNTIGDAFSLSKFFTKDWDKAKQVWADFQQTWQGAQESWNRFWKQDAFEEIGRGFDDMAKRIEDWIGAVKSFLGIGGGTTGGAITEPRQERARRDAGIGSRDALGRRQSQAIRSGMSGGVIESPGSPDERGERRRVVVGQGDVDRAVRTVLAEAGNQGDVGMQAVAHVIRNRSLGTGRSLSDIVTARNQFEPWNTARGRARMAGYRTDSDEYRRAHEIVTGVMNGTIADPTGGATHFLNQGTSASRGDSAMRPGGWGRRMANQRRIGAHTFGNAGGFGRPVGTGPTGLSFPRGTMDMMPIVGPQSLSGRDGRGGRSFADNSSTNVTVHINGNADRREVEAGVNRALQNRGRDSAKSLFLRAQEPQTA